MPVDCPFCERLLRLPAPDIANELAVGFDDAFPASPGHTLIVSRRHVARLAELSGEESAALWALVPAARRRIEQRHSPHGYNLGLNDGEAAGQTVPHVHLHVIPRFAGDTADPRGGVRRAIPEAAAYWEWTDDGG